MKNMIKMWGITALLAVIVFSMAGCSSPTGGDPDLSGAITISPSTGVTTGTELTATYDGSEVVSYQWKKDGANVGTDSNKYTPDTAGSYTVTVSAAGFKSKTSAAVEVIITPLSSDITYSVEQTGGTDGTIDSTGIVFTFSGSVDSLNLTAADITVGGTAAKDAAALSGTGTTRTLSPITVSAAGQATVQITKPGIEAGTKYVTVFKNTTATDTRTATVLTIKTQPTKLTYTHGETLDLAGLVVTLTFDDHSSDDVAAANFADHNITADPAHGDHLIHSTHNGHPVTVEYGDLEADTNNLTVNKTTGAAVSAPTAATIGWNSVTLAAITLTNGQTVEYASNTANTAPSTGWQAGTTISGLTPLTTYYFFARSAGDGNYETGAASGGTAITTGQQAEVIIHWIDNDNTGDISIGEDGDPITGNTVTVTYGDSITFEAGGTYDDQAWTVNGAIAGTGDTFTFDTANRIPGKDYIIGLRVQQDDKYYFTQITVKVQE